VELVDGADVTGVDVVVVVADEVEQATKVMLKRWSRTVGARIVMVVTRLKDGHLLELASCGVMGVLRRADATAEELTRAVLSVRRGDGHFPPDLLGRLLEQAGRSGGRGGPAVASPNERECEVLTLVAEGLSTTEIAVKLSYSERTVKNVLHALVLRLNLRNRAHAVAYAIREGYI
jgi:DNA-binding NarL/FixJ family response regulator